MNLANTAVRPEVHALLGLVMACLAALLVRGLPYALLRSANRGATGVGANLGVTALASAFVAITWGSLEGIMVAGAGAGVTALRVFSETFWPWFMRTGCKGTLDAQLQTPGPERCTADHIAEYAGWCYVDSVTGVHVPIEGCICRLKYDAQCAVFSHRRAAETLRAALNRVECYAEETGAEIASEKDRLQ